MSTTLAQRRGGVERGAAVKFLRLYGIDLSWTPAFYFTHVDCAVERNTVPCENP